MSHPRLSRWLSEAMKAYGFNGWAAEGIVEDGSDPAIADRLERALGCCAVCGMWEGWSDHETNPGVLALIGRGGGWHPFVPLVPR